MQTENQNTIVFKQSSRSNNIEVRLGSETVWLTQNQMSALFDKDVNTISEHIQNIFKEKELEEVSTSRKFRVVQSEGNRQVNREVTHYNLDIIISVGYRVKSVQGTRFRIWANKILKDYLIKGYAVNQKKLEAEVAKYNQLQKYLKTLKSVNENEDFNLDESKSLIKIITDYADGLNILEQFDNNNLEVNQTNVSAKKLDYSFAISEIKILKEKLNLSNLFGSEKDNGFKSAIESIFQTYAGKDLYPSIEEKAANLLYLVIKNHPFVDGNKRIGSFMFIRFLDINGMLYKLNGSKSIEDNALVAIALLVAQSNMRDKAEMIKLIVNLINL